MMQKDKNVVIDRYNMALERNLAELNNAILKRRALTGLHGAQSVHSLDFFRIAGHALSNDILSHLIKVYDRPKSASFFWLINGTDKKILDEITTKHSIDLDKVKTLSKRFKTIRDKTHFHIDKDAVTDTSKIWKEAQLTGNDVGYLLESGFTILNWIYEKRTGKAKELPDYDGSDVPDIIRSYKKCFPRSAISIEIEDTPRSNLVSERLRA